MSDAAGPEDSTVRAIRRWVERLVIAHNLCPFARRELDAGTVRFVVTDVTGEAELLLALSDELERLNREPEIETTLLIHPQALLDFLDFNQFLATCDELLRQLSLEGIYQVASFHPDYQFAGTRPEDAENYSNRSPYPVLHILREASVARAVAAHPDPEGIPDSNIAVLNRLGREHLAQLLQTCFEDHPEK